jgi:hypothetical protein
VPPGVHEAAVGRIRASPSPSPSHCPPRTQLCVCDVLVYRAQRSLTPAQPSPLFPHQHARLRLLVSPRMSDSSPNSAATSTLADASSTVSASTVPNATRCSHAVAGTARSAASADLSLSQAAVAAPASATSAEVSALQPTSSAVASGVQAETTTIETADGWQIQTNWPQVGEIRTPHDSSEDAVINLR